MNDTNKIIIGLLIFLVLVTFPIWYSAATGKSGYTPEMEYPEKKPCVEGGVLR